MQGVAESVAKVAVGNPGIKGTVVRAVRGGNRDSGHFLQFSVLTYLENILYTSGMAVLTVPKILREKLTEEGADALVLLLDNLESHAHDNTLEVAEEKFEKRLAQLHGSLETRLTAFEGNLKTEITGFRGEFDSKFTGLKGEFDSKFAGLKGEFDSKIAEVKAEMASFKAELIKWMFLFWIGQVAVTAGLFFTFLRLR